MMQDHFVALVFRVAVGAMDHITTHIMSSDTTMGRGKPNTKTDEGTSRRRSQRD